MDGGDGGRGGGLFCVWFEGVWGVRGGVMGWMDCLVDAEGRFLSVWTTIIALACCVCRYVGQPTSVCILK